MTQTLQTAFAEAILDPQKSLPEGIVNPEGDPAPKRFNVYRNNVIVSLLDAMETAFPVIQKLIGSENFRNLSGVYVRQHPPQNPMLMFYGADFPDFLAGFEPVAHLPYLADVARLELARRTAYHAADADPIAPDALGQIPPDRLMGLQLEFSPAMQLLQSAYPVAQIWHFNMTEGAPKPQPVAENLMVFRPEFDLDMVVISDGQLEFVKALQSEQNLGDAFESANGIEEGFDLAAGIGLLLSTQIITKTTH